jgi:hypothetical protein
VDQKRARALEIAKILKDIGYLDQVLGGAPDHYLSAVAPRGDDETK